MGARRRSWVWLRLLRFVGAVVRCGAVQVRCDSSSGWEDEQPGPCPGLGSSIGEGFLIIVTGVLGLGVLRLPGLRHWKFRPRGRRQCDKTV